MSDIKNWGTGQYILFFIGLLIVWGFIANFTTIFPVMSDNEYFEEEDDLGIIIHGKSCPICSVPWFTEKTNKYDILIKRNAEFCDVCFGKNEIEKLWMLHEYNLERHCFLLRINGASDEYIETELLNYEPTTN